MKFIANREIRILIITLIISSILITLGILSRDVGVLGNTVILATFIIATPQLLMRYERYRELKEMEAKFPDFLRDLIESLRSGMPLHKAIQAASKLNYGKLSKEIKKMSNQISWGMPLPKVLEQFSDRVKSSKRLFTITKIINESYLSGGDIVASFESMADNATILDEVEKERKSMLNQYVVLMYIISLLFIGIVVVMNRLLIPVFQTAVTGTEFAALSNPCDTCQGMGCNICDLYSITSSYVFSVQKAGIANYYVSLFFYMAIIQAIFAGLVAGQISENSVVAGIKHSLILAAIIFGSFSILIRLGFLGV
ncbi:MAG: type II secretion system F family protein [Candidatus Aenigmatarchaeota archaeon]